MSRVASFDIFDTLLARSVGAPRAVFILVARRARRDGLISCAPRAFADARTDAERRANLRAGMPEAPMDAIYRELAEILALSPEAAEAIRRMELETEARVLKPVCSGLARLHAARGGGEGRGDRIAFLSDMYLPEEFIREQLARVGAWRDGDLFLLSSVIGVTKYTGAMFHEAAKRLNTTPRSIRHLGNSRAADVEGPRKAGAVGEFFNDANPTRFEEILNRHTDQTEGLSALFSGAARLARLSMRERGAGRVRSTGAGDAGSGGEEAARAFVGVSAGVIAPVLGAYCLWLLRRAERAGVDRLYFVSRDGEVLLDIARGLAAKIGSKVELRYLHGSRQAWHLPSVTALGEKEFLWLLERSEVSSVRRVCSRVEMGPERIAAALGEGGFPPGAWDEPLNSDGLARLRAVFERDDVARVVQGRAAEARALCLDYFRAQGLLDHDRWALVDVGWRARLQTSVKSILATANGPVPRGFYFGLNDTPGEKDCGPVECFLFERKRNVGPPGLPTDLSTHMEMFCCATHGTVTGYRRSVDGGVEPTLKWAINQRAMDWGLMRMRDTIAAFVQHLDIDGTDTWADLDADLRPAVTELLRELSYHPAPAEAASYGAFDFASDQSEEHFTRFARAHTPFSGFRSVLPPRFLPKKADVRWQGGSIELAPAWFRWVLRQAFRFRLRMRDRYRAH